MEKILAALIEVIKEAFPPEEAAQFADKLLDKLEDKIDASENKWDDALAKPAIQYVREAFGIEDGEE